MPIGRMIVGILAKDGWLIPKKLRIAWKFSNAKLKYLKKPRNERFVNTERNRPSFL